MEGGGELDTVAGDTDRVEGAFTAMESAVDATVDSEVVDPVRRSDAASRGRAAIGGVLADAPEAPAVLALMLILAAS